MYSGKREAALSTPSAMNLGFPKRSGSSQHLKVGASPTSTRKRKRLDSDHESRLGLLNDDQLVPCGELEQPLEDMDMFPTGSKKRFIQSSAAITHQHSKGLFERLPTELFHLILSLLPSDDIASFSLASSQINLSIREYIFTVAGSRHVLPSAHPLVMGGGHVLSAMPFNDENEYSPKDSNHTNVKETVKEFESLGMLTKQLTMFQPIRSRLKVASFILNKLECTHQTLIMFAGHSAAYCCFGRLLFSFIRGWGDYEKVKAFNLIQTIAKLEQRTKKVLHTEPSSQPLLERDIRLVHRCVFLDHAAKLGEREYGFWLTLILKQWPITFQARLLYLLTAPENDDGFVSWTLVCGCSNIQHFMMSVNFSELANSLRVLLEFSPKEWSLDHIISIVDELTTTPNGWCLENVSQLLVHCGKDISKGVLGCRAVNGRTDELVIICFYMANACLMKDGFEDGSEENIRWFIDILRSTLSMLPVNSKKGTFIYNLVEKWQDYLTALFEDCTPEHYESETVQTEFLNTLGNFTKLSSVLFQLVVE